MSLRLYQTHKINHSRAGDGREIQSCRRSSERKPHPARRGQRPTPSALPGLGTPPAAVRRWDQPSALRCPTTALLPRTRRGGEAWGVGYTPHHPPDTQGDKARPPAASRRGPHAPHGVPRAPACHETCGQSAPRRGAPCADCAGFTPRLPPLRPTRARTPPEGAAIAPGLQPVTLSAMPSSGCGHAPASALSRATTPPRTNAPPSRAPRPVTPAASIQPCGAERLVPDAAAVAPGLLRSGLRPPALPPEGAAIVPVYARSYLTAVNCHAVC